MRHHCGITFRYFLKDIERLRSHFKITLLEKLHFLIKFYFVFIKPKTVLVLITEVGKNGN